MHRLGNILAIIAVVMLIFSFFGCAPDDAGGSLRVLESPAEIEISGERNGIAFTAVMSVSGGEGRISFSSPDSMKGLTVLTSGGVWGSELGEVGISGVAPELIGAPMKAFLDFGEVVSVEKQEGGRTLINARSEDLTREYLIDSKSGLPVQIKEKSTDGALIMRIDIIKYEIKEEK